MEQRTLQAAYDTLKTLAGQSIQVRAHQTKDVIYIDLLEWREIRYAVAKSDILTLELDRTTFNLIYRCKGTTTVDAVIEKMNQLRHFKIASILA